MRHLLPRARLNQHGVIGYRDILVTGNSSCLFSLTSRHKEVGISRSNSGKDKLWSPELKLYAAGGSPGDDRTGPHHTGHRLPILDPGTAFSNKPALCPSPQRPLGLVLGGEVALPPLPRHTRPMLGTSWSKVSACSHRDRIIPSAHQSMLNP